MLQKEPATRRKFLANSSLLLGAALLPDSMFSQATEAPATGPAQPVVPTPDTVLKFSPDGKPRPFAGNTVICHLPAQCAVRDTSVQLHEALAKAPFHTKLGLTSTDSYHMTVFPGANDQRRTAYGWPSYVPLDAPMDVCNRLVGERMAEARLHCQLPIRVRVDYGATLRNTLACTLRLIAADGEEETKLRSVRDQLADVYGFRLPDHATYGFHMTLSYQITPFTPKEQAAYTDLLRTHVRAIMASEPILELGEPEYCTFPDMFRFEPMHLLTCS